MRSKRFLFALPALIAVFCVSPKAARSEAIDLTKAVGIGMILAAGLFVKRVAETTQVQAMTGDQGEPGQEKIKDLPGDVVVYRVFGALLFGAADKLDTVLRRAGGGVNVIILHMASVTSMDTTALDRLELIERAQLRAMSNGKVRFG